MKTPDKQQAGSGTAKPLRQRIRRLLIYFSFFAFPVTMNFMSPYVVMQASFEGVLAGSGIVFGVLLLHSLVLGRLFCGWLYPAGGLNEILTEVNGRRVTSRKIRWFKFYIWVIWLGALAVGFISSGGIRQVRVLYLTESGVSVDEPLKYIMYFLVVLIFLLISVIAGRRASCHAIC